MGSLSCVFGQGFLKLPPHRLPPGEPLVSEEKPRPEAPQHDGGWVVEELLQPVQRPPAGPAPVQADEGDAGWEEGRPGGPRVRRALHPRYG